MTDAKLDLIQGTLDLMVLQTLAVMGSQHGYGIARRIEQVSGDRVLLNQGTVYAALIRLHAARLDLVRHGERRTTTAKRSSTPSPSADGSNSPRRRRIGSDCPA